MARSPSKMRTSSEQAVCTRRVRSSLISRCFGSHGFDNINLDLIAGLPGQQMETWKRNLDRVLELRPEHISIYMLDQEERSAWAKLPPGVPDESDFADFYTLAESRLEVCGLSSLRDLELGTARAGMQAQYRLLVRRFRIADLVSAHILSMESRRFWNTSSLAEYAESVDAGRLPILGEEVLSSSHAT